MPSHPATCRSKPYLLKIQWDESGDMYEVEPDTGAGRSVLEHNLSSSHVLAANA